jgi:excisionase family DNA binding protein
MGGHRDFPPISREKTLIVGTENELLQGFLERLDRMETALARGHQQEWFSVEEVAAIVGVSSKHIRRARKRGELAYSNLGGDGRPTYRFRYGDVVAWMESKRARPRVAKPSRPATIKIGKFKDYFADAS